MGARATEQERSLGWSSDPPHRFTDGILPKSEVTHVQPWQLEQSRPPQNHRDSIRSYNSLGIMPLGFTLL